MIKKILPVLALCICIFACDNEPLEGEFITDDTTMDEGSDTDDSDTDGDTDGTVSFNADVDGVTVNPDSLTAFSIESGGVTSINIGGVNTASGASMTLTFNAALEAGTYEFNSLPLPGNTILTYAPDPSDATLIYSSEAGGTFVISEVTAEGRFTGTFSATLSVSTDPSIPGVEVTNGAFIVQL
jgi:hypothetical protein